MTTNYLLLNTHKTTLINIIHNIFHFSHDILIRYCSNTAMNTYYRISMTIHITKITTTIGDTIRADITYRYYYI